MPCGACCAHAMLSLHSFHYSVCADAVSRVIYKAVEEGAGCDDREARMAALQGSSKCSTSGSRDLASAFNALKVGGDGGAPAQQLFSARLDAVQDATTGAVPALPIRGCNGWLVGHLQKALACHELKTVRVCAPGDWQQRGLNCMM